MHIRNGRCAPARLSLGRFLAYVLVMSGFLELIVPAKAAPPTSAFTLTSSAITLAPNQENGSATFVLKLTGDAASRSGSLQLRDRGSRDTPEVTVVFEEDDPNVGDGSLTWFITATAAGLPANSILPRFLTASYAGYTQTLPYTLSNKPETAFTWKLLPVAEVRRWNASDPLRFTVSVGPVTATSVRLLSSSFMDGEELNVLGRVFRLCADREPQSASACDGRPISLAANETHILSIRPLEAGAVVPGEYKGSFTLVAAEKPDGESFPVTLHVSQPGWQVAGAILIAAGLVLAWLVNVFLQRRNEQNVALMPAALLVEQVENLRIEHSRFATLTSLELGNTAAHLEKVLTALSKKTLKASGYINSAFAFFSRPAGTGQPAKTYQQYLAEADELVALLSLLIEGGFRQAMHSWKPTRPESERAIIVNALNDMDALVAAGMPLPTKEGLAASLQARLTAMRNALTAASGVQDDSQDAVTSRVGYSSERISFETAAINAIGWAVFAALSFVVGWYVLIVSDPSFGQWKDLLLCFLWGFGLPAAGEKLASLSSPSVAKAFGVTLTRAAA
jgi:hypothetical protein